MSDERETEGVDGSTHLLAGEMIERPSNSENPENDSVDAKLVKEDGKLNSNRETSEVKFISADSQNGDAKIDIENVKNAFAGMGKEELMKYANDPFWIRMRWFLFVFFWVLWIAMLLGAVAIIVLAPKCPAPPQLKWWEQSPLYEVNVRSFVDGENEDGVGDLVGLKSQLDYIRKLGVKGIIISSIFKSSHKMQDGYVENFKEIDPLLGTLDDFTDLTAAVKERDMHIILDFIPNHTSMKHHWFNSSESKIEPYTDYYVWRHGKSGSDGKEEPPNNWGSIYGGSAWKYSETRKEFFLHQFARDQPDLNFRNPAVIDEFKEILKFWLEHGASGFQLSNVEHLVEDNSWADENFNIYSGAPLNEYGSITHSKTTYLPEVLDVLQELRDAMKNVSSSDSVLAVSINGSHRGILVKDSNSNMTNVFDIMRDSDLFSGLKPDFTAQQLSTAISSWNTSVPKCYRQYWELGNSKRSRIASRLSVDVIDGLNAVVMLLPGTPITFYGDELGMSDSEVSDVGPLAPMSWENTTGAGFSVNETVTALSSNYQENNVRSEDGKEGSHLQIYRTLSEKARSARSIMYGVFESTVFNDTVYAYTRFKSGNPGYLVAFNPSDEAVTANLMLNLTSVSDDLTLVVKSPHVEAKQKYQASSLYLPPKGVVVFTFVPKQQD